MAGAKCDSGHHHLPYGRARLTGRIMHSGTAAQNDDSNAALLLGGVPILSVPSASFVRA